MELKKLPEANLERKRFIFFQIGFIISLLAVLLAFEWTTKGGNENNANEVLVSIEMDVEVMPEIQKEEPKPPKPVPYLPEFIPLVDNDVELTEELSYPDEARLQPTTYFKAVELEREPEEELVFLPSEEMPEFPGGEASLKKFIAKHLQYPQAAIDEEIKGRVYVHFLIDSDGKVKKAQVVKSIHPLIDQEALRVINLLPNWKPATQNGRSVSVWYTIPVTFWFE